MYFFLNEANDVIKYLLKYRPQTGTGPCFILYRAAQKEGKLFSKNVSFLLIIVLIGKKKSICGSTTIKVQRRKVCSASFPRLFHVAMN